MYIEKMTEKHEEEVLVVLLDKYRRIYKEVAVLPVKYNVDQLRQLVEYMVKTNVGYVYIEDKVVAFIHLTYVGELFYNKQGVYTAEWAHNLEDVDNLKGLMLLNKLYDYMLSNELKDHTISLFDHKKDFLMNLFNLSYGSRCLDAHMIVEKHHYTNNRMRKVIKEDFTDLIGIIDEHHQHLIKPPTIIGRQFESALELLNEWYEEQNVHMYLLEVENQIIGMIKMVHGQSGGCDSSYNDKTLGIETTQLLSSHQNMGYGREMIDFMKAYAYDNGFTHIAVDFETMNYRANQFWLKSFEPTIRSLIRTIG